MIVSSDTIPKSRRIGHFRLAALTVSFSCLTVAITVARQLLPVDHFAIEHASEQARPRLQQLSWGMRDALDRTLQQAVRDVYLVSALPQLRHPDPSRACQILDKLQDHFGDYAWIGVAQLDGKVLAATDGLLENSNVSARTGRSRTRLPISAVSTKPRYGPMPGVA